jgi:HK97 family phage portal protein
VDSILSQAFGFGTLQQVEESRLEVVQEVRSTASNGIPDIPDLEQHLLKMLGIEGIEIKASVKVAMGLPTFFSAVNLISDLIATQPIGVFYEDEKGNTQSGNKHQLHYLIKHRPNQQMSSFIFRKVMIMNMKVYGYAIAQIFRDKFGRPTAIRPFATKDVQLYQDPDSLACFFKISNRPGLVLSEEDVIFLKDVAFDGTRGSSVVSWQSQTIELPATVRAFARKNLQMGAFIAGFITAPIEPTDAEAADIYKTRILESLRGDKFGGYGLAVLGHGADYKPVSRGIVESAVTELLEQSDEDIAKVFRIPLVMLGDTRKSTSFGKGIDSLYILLVSNVLMPIVVQMEQEIAYKCFTNKELREEGYFVRENMRGLLRGDAATYAEYINKMHQNGVYSINEIRKWDELTSVEGGDRHFVQQNLMPIDKVDEILKDKSKNNGNGKENTGDGADGGQISDADEDSES